MSVYYQRDNWIVGDGCLKMKFKNLLQIRFFAQTVTTLIVVVVYFYTLNVYIFVNLCFLNT